MNKNDVSSSTIKTAFDRVNWPAVTASLKALSTAFSRITKQLATCFRAIGNAVRCAQQRVDERSSRVAPMPRMRVTNATASTHVRRVWKPTH